MKKQFITGVLLLAATAVGFSTFTSCKDTDEDLYNELNSEQVSLRATLQKLQEQLNQCPTTCQTKIDSLKNELTEMINKKANSTDVYTKTEVDSIIDSLLRELQNTYVALATYNAAMNGENGILARLTALEEKEYPEPGEAQFTDEQVQDILGLLTVKATLDNLVTLYPDLNGLFGETGTLAGLQSSIDALDEILNGKDGKPGLVSTVNDLSKWFEGKNWEVKDFQDAVEQGMWVSTNHEALQALVDLKDKLNEDALDALNTYYQDFAAIDEMYEKIWKNATLPEGAEDWWNYGEVMQNIMDNSAEIAVLKDDVDKLLNRLNDMVTSLVLQATNNSVFGGFNTPFGINSMVLMTVYGDLATSIEQFPASGVGAECYSAENDDIDWAALVPELYDLNERGTKKIVALNKDKQATLGNLWFTVNPGTVNNLDVNGFAIVNSVENDVVKVTNVTKDDETVLKFGVGSRAAGNGNGLYKAEVSVDPENLDDIKVHIESGLVQSLKDAVKNRTASDMVQMFKAIYNQLQDVCDANALRYTYKAATGKDANGNWVETDQKVYSNYGMAATAFKPLSYATLKGTSIGAHLPSFGSIELPKDLVDLDLGTFTVDSKNFSLNLSFGAPEFDNTANPIVKTNVTLYDQYNNPVTGEVTINISDQTDAIFNDLTSAINTWLNGADGEPSLDEKMNEAIWYALFNDPEGPAHVEGALYQNDPTKKIGVVASLVNQVNDMTGNIQDKLDSLMDKINKDYLGKVNSLISKYNTVADRINNALKDPNHYLQSVMLYRKAGKLGLNGHTPEVELPFGILSTNPKQPTQFKGAGEAISLWATSYTFETVAPAFKKCVAVVSVKDQDGNLREDLVQDANKTLAKVMNGDRTRVALDVKNAKGGVFTYEVAFQALDYTGHTSTVKCYLQVVR